MMRPTYELGAMIVATTVGSVIDKTCARGEERKGRRRGGGEGKVSSYILDVTCARGEGRGGGGGGEGNCRKEGRKAAGEGKGRLHRH